MTWLIYESTCPIFLTVVKNACHVIKPHKKNTIYCMLLFLTCYLYSGVKKFSSPTVQKNREGGYFMITEG